MDDWGADFVGGIVLTPKTGGAGSTWGRGQAAFAEEDEETDGSCAATCDGSVRKGFRKYICVLLRHTAVSGSKSHSIVAACVSHTRTCRTMEIYKGEDSLYVCTQASAQRFIVESR